MKRLHRIALSLCLSLLLCVTCSSLFSVKASAAEVSPNAKNEWFLLPFNDISVQSNLVGSFNNTSGLYNATGNLGSGTYLNFTDHLSGGVFPSLLSGHRYLLYYNFTGVADIDFVRIVIRKEWDDRSEFTSIYPLNHGSIVSNTDVYVNDTTTLSGIIDFVADKTITFSTGSALLLEISPYSFFDGRTDWAFYLLDITDNTESEVNQIIAAIQDQTGQIKDKIDEVLTPEGENNLGEAVDQITDQVQENLGALGFAHDTIENFIGLFNEEPPAPIINVPPLKMKIKGVEHQFFNGYQYDFRSMEDNGLSVLVGAVRTAGTLVLWWAFLQYCLKEFDGFFRR